jgi:hypothetical protein
MKKELADYLNKETEKLKSSQKAEGKGLTLSIIAKCSDMFSASLLKEGKTVAEYDGYVPKWFPAPNVTHYGDYVELEIDIATGKILNWKEPTEAQLNETFKPEETTP